MDGLSYHFRDVKSAGFVSDSLETRDYFVEMRDVFSLHGAFGSQATNPDSDEVAVFL